MKTGSLFGYYGSKWQLASKLACEGVYPPHHVFVDVFGGTGALLAGQQPQGTEVLNDLDSYVFNVFATVQDPVACETIIDWLHTTDRSRSQFYACKQILKDSTASDARRAWAFLVCGTIGHHGHPLCTGWSNQSSRTIPGLIEKLRWWHERLQGVRIENRPWQEIITMFDSPATIFACDPPYLPEVLTSPQGNYYRKMMTSDDHVELIERLRQIQGYALLCGYNHPLYTQHLFHWRKRMAPRKQSFGNRTEIVWLNYADDGSKLDSVRLLIAKRFIEMLGGIETARDYFERMCRLMRLPD